jgi:hypothetical protein
LIDKPMLCKEPVQRVSNFNQWMDYGTRIVLQIGPFSARECLTFFEK